MSRLFFHYLRRGLGFRMSWRLAANRVLESK